MNVLIDYIVPATVLLGVLIFVHELGHCLVAKMVGVRVLKFSLGFGPKLFGKKIGETEYLLSLIPLGGYVKPLGESPDEPVREEDKPYSLNHQSLPRRFAILAAGSVFNILFALVIFSAVYMVGTPMLIARVGEVVDGSPAQKAGLMQGDMVTAIDGKKIELWDELSSQVQASRGRPLTFSVQRSGETHTAVITPQLSPGHDELGNNIETYRIGIVAERSENAFITKRYDPVTALWKGTQETLKWSRLTLMGIGMMIRSPIERKDDIGGPILIGKLAGDFARVSLLSYVLLMAMISVNLGVLNLLPIPILDGGHILFLFLEAIKGAPVSIRKMELAQQVGMALLLMLMAFVIYNDITRFIQP